MSYFMGVIAFFLLAYLIKTTRDSSSNASKSSYAFSKHSGGKSSFFSKKSSMFGSSKS
jgi:hypothetical protein